ncbi:glycoprotein-N-acetylgalactosamine 3-beta-galactosyltransferase 1-like [Sycon ciliatum]|uniref:glycoprotein-N-acetylgalactosamine 3-beta-galactosyltransferase 1-like n=1 Tax=Sycon ciliatum TaxID=27933 RepID=UPI0020ABFEA3
MSPAVHEWCRTSVALCIGITLLLSCSSYLSSTWQSSRVQDENGFRKRAEEVAGVLRTGEEKASSRQVQKVLNVRVLCWVLTGSRTIAIKGSAILATWGRRCDRLLFMTSGKDRTLLPGRVSLPGVTEGRAALVAKSREAWKYVYEVHRAAYDWFYKCDDDTYTVVENLKFMLYTRSTAQPRFLGKHLRTPDGSLEWVSGGAGYVLNRAALGKLREQIGKGCMMNDRIPSEDQLVSLCLKSAGVNISDSRDAAKSRILPLSPEMHLTPGAVASSKYKWVLTHSAGKSEENEGPGCCSELAVSFHYISPQSQYALDYLINKLHKFGAWSSDRRRLENS